MKKALTFLFLSSLLLVSCASSLQLSATPPVQPIPPSPSAEESPTPSSTAAPPPTRAPAPSATAQLASISLGKPVWMGRGQIISARFLPDESGVVVGWANGITLNDLQTGQERWLVEAPTELMALDLDPSGQRAAAAFTDGSLLVIDTASGQSHRFAGSGPDVYWGDIRFSPDGQTLAYQFIGPDIRSDPIYLLDLAGGQVRAVPNSQIDSHIFPILTWSPDGQTISLANLSDLGGGCSRLLDVATGATRLALGQPGHCLNVSSLAWDPGGASFVALDEANRPERFSFPSGKPLGKLQKGSPIAFDPMTKHMLSFDPQGKWLASRTGIQTYYGADYDPITVWDAATGRVLARSDHPVRVGAALRRSAAAFMGGPGEEHLLMLYDDGAITRWNFLTKQKEQEVGQLLVSAADPFSVRWSADGTRMAFTGLYGGVSVWDTATGALVYAVPGPVSAPALNSDGSRLALFNSVTGEEQVIDLAAQAVILRLKSAAQQNGAAFSPDGRSLAYTLGSRAAVADIASGSRVTLEPSPEGQPGPGQTVTGFAWSPDGTALVVLSGMLGSPEAGGKLVLWQRDAAGGEFHERLALDCVFAGYPPVLTRPAAFSPSGRRVALQKMPTNEAGQAELIFYNLAENSILRSEQEYTIGAWVDEDVFLEIEAQYYTRLTRLNVLTGAKDIGSGINANDNVYAPGGAYYLSSGDFPPIFRGVVIRGWRKGDILAQAEHGWVNAAGHDWSPDGGHIASFGAEGSVRVWPVIWP